MLIGDRKDGQPSVTVSHGCGIPRPSSGAAGVTAGPLAGGIDEETEQRVSGPGDQEAHWD